MGVALAEEARRRGADVTLLAANLAVPAARGIEVVETPTAEALLARGARARRRRPRPDVRRGRRLPAGRAVHREAPEGRRAVDGRARADRGRRQDPGRAARERPGDRRLRRRARRGGARAQAARCSQTRTSTSSSTTMCRRSDIGFDSKDNEVVLITRAGERRIAKAPKSRIAAAVLDEAVALLEWTLARAPSTPTRRRRRSTAIVANIARVVHAPGRDAAARRPLPRQRGPPDHRGLPGRRQDDAREGARALARLQLLAHPVHARPAAVGHHGRQRLRPAHERIRLPRRARSSRTSSSSTR